MNIFSFYWAALWFSLFFPTFSNTLGYSGAMLIIVGSAAIVTPWLLLKGSKSIFKNASKNESRFILIVLTFFLFFSFHIVLSMVVGVIFGDVNLIFRDFYEIHRPVYYALVFLFSFLVFRDLRDFEYFTTGITITFLVVTGFGLFQFFDLNRGFSVLYTKYANIRMGRVAIPFGNPYYYSFFVSFFVLFFFSKIIFSGFRYVPLFVLSIIMFVLPQSRSVAVGLLLGFFVIIPGLLVILSAPSGSKLYKRYFYGFVFFVLVCFSFLALIPILLENFPYLTGQFVRTLSGEGIGSSASARLDQFLFAVNKAGSNIPLWLIGNGPSKNEMEYVESIYVYQFYRYGLFGLVLYLAIPILLFSILSWRTMRIMGRYNSEYAFHFALVAWFLTIPLMSVGNNFTEQVRLSFVYYSFLGLVAGRYFHHFYYFKKQSVS
ncbi:MAG: hypothetical protein HLX50_15875 [Alteromonadaceae bacterium]|nr:hypothetical protein [Alteromonadaceae bacterium]